MQQFFEGLIQAGQMTPQAASQINAMLAGAPVKYNVNVVIYNNSQYIEANCNQILFYNQGTSNVNVNGVILAQNVGWSIPGNLGEMDVTKYNAVFDNTGSNSLLVIRKNYVS